MSDTIFVLNGPNLNLLGQRRPEVYGYTTLHDIERMVRERAAAHGFDVEFMQSNHEGVLVDEIQRARTRGAAIIINPAAYTHTSVALHDALEAAELPVVEVHLSNVHRREEFRHRSFVSPQATAVIAGAGAYGSFGLVPVCYSPNTAEAPGPSRERVGASAVFESEGRSAASLLGVVKSPRPGGYCLRQDPVETAAVLLPPSARACLRVLAVMA